MPKAPGVYVFRAADGEALYIGKAKSLHSRMASHINDPKTRGGHRLLEMTDHLEWTVTDDEWQALLLEQNMIQEQQPRFNVRLRYGNAYNRIAVSLDEEYPRMYITREKPLPGRRYYGPYESGYGHQLLDTLMKVLYIRSCPGPAPGRTSGSPCLDFHIDRCQAPCIDNVSKVQYRKGVSQAMNFLSGKKRPLINSLKSEMRKHVKAEEFENAAAVRNRLIALEAVQQVKGESMVVSVEADVVGVDSGEEDLSICILEIREGMLFGSRHYLIGNDGGDEEGAVVRDFLMSLYGYGQNLPKLLIVPECTKEPDVIEKFIAQTRDAAVSVRIARQGQFKHFADLAKENAAQKRGQQAPENKP